MLPDLGKLEHYIGHGFAVRDGVYGAKKMKAVSIASHADERGLRISSITLKDENGYCQSFSPEQCYRNRREVLEEYNVPYGKRLEHELENLRVQENSMNYLLESIRRKIAVIEKKLEEFNKGRKNEQM